MAAAFAFRRRFDPSALGESNSVLILGAIGAVVALQLHLIFTKSVNWDEFYHFSQIYDLGAGRLVQSLQTFHARLLSWVILLPGDNIAHIQYARMIMLGAELVVAASIYGLARRFVHPDIALLCSLAWLSGGYAFLHSFALRPDTLAAAALMTALWIAGTRPLARCEAILVGALCGFALMMTIKIVFYLPAFAGIAWLRWNETAAKAQALHFAGSAGGSFVVVFALLYAWHSSAIQAVDAGSSSAVLADSLWRMFSAGLFPRDRFLLVQIAYAPILAFLIFFAPRAWLEEKLDRPRLLCLIGLAAPLLSVAFYRNAFPYFYGFILPPVVVAISPSILRALRTVRPGLLAGALLANAAVLHAKEDREVLDRQRTLIAGVHEIFPEPVVYFDEPGIVGDYPRATSWMVSGWGLEKYRERGAPELSEIARREVAPLAIAKGAAFESALTGARRDEQLLPADQALIGDNYIAHWGIVYVAGKRIAPGAQPIEIEVAVPGPYTLEGAPLVIDGETRAVGEVLTLSRGKHLIDGGRAAAATLRWGDHINVPRTPFPDGRLFTTY